MTKPQKQGRLTALKPVILGALLPPNGHLRNFGRLLAAQWTDL